MRRLCRHLPARTTARPLELGRRRDGGAGPPRRCRSGSRPPTRPQARHRLNDLGDPPLSSVRDWGTESVAVSRKNGRPPGHWVSAVAVSRKNRCRLRRLPSAVRRLWATYHRSMPPKIHSQDVTEGFAKAGARAMLRAVGLEEDDFARPQVGLVSAGNEVTPATSPVRCWRPRPSGGSRQRRCRAHVHHHRRLRRDLHGARGDARFWCPAR